MSLIGNKIEQHVKDGLLGGVSYGNMQVRLGLLKDVNRQLCHGFHFAVDGASTPILAPNAGVGSVPDYTIQFAAATTVRLISTNANDGTAFSILTLAANASDGDTFTIGTRTYTLQTTLTDVDGNIHIDSTAALTILNIVDAIILGSGGEGVGTGYATSTTLNADVTAADGTGDTIDFTSKVFPAGTLVTTETGANLSFGATTMASTGVLLVQVIGLDANYNPKFEFLSPNGTAFGTASAGTFIAINEMLGVVVGSNGRNVGDIYCSDATDTSTSGVPDNIIYSGIRAAAGFSQTAIMTVPLGFSAVMTHFNWATGAATNANPALYIPTVQIVGGSNLIVATLPADRGAGDYPLPCVLPLGEKSIIYIRCSRLSSSTSINCGAFWHFNLVRTSTYPGLN